ncbi:hypothetical protein L915_10569 [Phytophthora nicotianae]|uniref:HAT C-terminal dimerisation domain-containing protein n=1 Tax=Phytophthora nicotianae TaxID=4792 RepID=W2GNM3_PHYNI|nr:hypothetical protein L915_10569 [Phytophthora nicotianae]
MEIFKWMEWVIVRNQALSKVDDPPTHSLINTMPISSKALLRCMRHVATKVPNFSPMSTAILGARIAVDMGEKFGVLFDGWASGTLHFVAVYGLFSKGVFYIKRCLRSCPLNMDKELMFLEAYKPIIDQVQALCVQLRLPNNAAELARHTKYKPLKANATRWSSTFQMLTRYVKIRDAIKMVAAIEDLLPRPSTHRQIVQLVNKLEDLDSIRVKLQSEDCTLGEVRRLFDTVMAKYPATSHHHGASARIVHLPVFEDAVVKLLSDCEIIQEEEESVACFALPAPPPNEAPRNVDFATKTLRQAKRPRHGAENKYIDLLRLIPPTSNRCDRLFFQCKLVLNPLRASLLPANFEMLMFLRANRGLWDFTSLFRISDSGCQGEE